MSQPDTPKLHLPKLHLNEHISPCLANQLRKHGFDVTSSQESDLLSEPDDKQLEFAAAGRRAVVTFNARFSGLARKVFVGGTRALGHYPLIARTSLFWGLLKLLQTVSAHHLRNQVRWLNEFD
jgi:hypothetical protein